MQKESSRNIKAKKCFLAVFLNLAVLFAFAQDGFEKGYIITYKGDTTRGKIKDRKYPSNIISWQKIVFISDKNEQEKLTAEDIKGYVKNDSIAYQTLTLGIEEKKRFVAVITTGAVLLFADITNVVPAGAKTNSSVFGPGLFVNIYIGGSDKRAEGQYYLQKKGDVNSLMEWRDRDYKTTAGYFFKDDKELIKLIEDDKYSYSDLQKIVKEYNLWKFRQ
jgi:hypothetical protein